MIDSRNTADLHPALERGAKELIKRMAEKGYAVLVTSTYRDNEKQNALYAQGRTTPGSVITNAKGGQSIHNYRLAFDICKNVKGHEFDDAAFFKCAGDLWSVMGGEWGGSWASFPDKPHFQFTGGLTLTQLQQGKVLPANAQLKWETVIKVEKKEDDEVIDKTVVLMNGKEVTVERIFKNDTNYIKLRDLEKLGLVIGYDEAKKMPTIAK